MVGLVSWVWWPGLVLALVDGLKANGIWVVGNVLLAGGIWDTLSVSERVDTTRVSAFTRATDSAVYDNLGIESNWSWVLVFEHNVEFIYQQERR